MTWGNNRTDVELADGVQVEIETGCRECSTATDSIPLDFLWWAIALHLYAMTEGLRALHVETPPPPPQANAADQAARERVGERDVSDHAAA